MVSKRIKRAFVLSRGLNKTGVSISLVWLRERSAVLCEITQIPRLLPPAEPSIPEGREESAWRVHEVGSLESTILIMRPWATSLPHLLNGVSSSMGSHGGEVSVS